LWMRVLKHTRLPLQPCSCQFRRKMDRTLAPLRLSLVVCICQFRLKVCFNTLWFFTPQKELYPTGRPFVCFLVCSDGTSFPYCTKWKTLEFLVPGSFWGILILVTVYDSSRTRGLLEMYSRDHSRAPRYLPGAWV
jgi:hypothetical protein